MKKSMLILAALLLLPVAVFAGSCENDRIVGRWIQDMERAEKHLVRVWAKGEPVQAWLEDIAVIFSAETNMAAKCKSEVPFLKRNLRMTGKSESPTVHTIPAMLFETLAGFPVLSPYRQFQRGAD